MLHRNFKPAKCKTSLKLAASRLKLMKNKKEVLLKQLKRELAQLLESGQDQTARIRVENAVREENTIAGYELLEIYCEIIAARLPIIESQKNCPNDLKEAIASVIFASPRCADITEFAEIRKHFTAKYGKEFVTAAVELRPESGVSRMLVEKLSVKAPDGETKIKILSAIAEEHNIKWDPTAFGVQESKPRDDLLNGPNTFENASKTHIELPAVQTDPSRIQVPPSSDLKDKNKPASSKQNATPASNLQNFPSGDGSSGSTTTQAAANPGRTPSGSGSERMDATHSHSRDGNAYSAGSHNWNMEFKDATAAAEAAAEAAERASMAARAAAELSGRGHIMTEHSTESPRFKSQGPRRERPSESVGSKLTGKQFSKESMHNTVYDKGPKIQSGHVDRNEHVKQEGFSETFHQDSRNSVKKSSLASSRPTTGSNDDEKLINKHQGSDLYLQKRQPEVKATEVKKNRVFSEVNKTDKNSKADVNLQSDDKQNDLHHDDMNHFGEERMKEKASGVTSQSHSTNHDTAYGISRSSQTSSIDDSENLFPSNDQDTTHGDAVASSSYNDTAVVFDDPLSDDDDFVVDTRSGYDVVEDPSPSSNLNAVHIDAAAKTSSSSNAAAAFDESDSDDEAFGFDSDPGRDESLTESEDYLKELDMLPVNFDDLGSPSSESEDDRYLNKSNTESNSEFKFGNLRGGLRNKRSPYTIYPPVAAAAASKTLPEDSAATTKQANPSSATRAESSTNIEVTAEVEQNPTSKLTTKISDVVRADSDDLSEQTPTSPGRAGGVFSRRTEDNSGLVAHSSLNARSKTEFKHKLSSPTSAPGSDSDDFEEDLSEKHFNRKRQPSSVKSSQQSNPKSQSGSPLKHFDSNDGASDAVKHTSISGRTGAAPSRRTKASPSPGANSYTKARVSGDTESNSEQRPSGSRSSYGSVTASKPEPQKVRPVRQDSSAEKSKEQATPKPIPKNELRSESSATEQTSSPLKAAKSGSSASPKPSSSSSGGDPSSKEGTSVGPKPSSSSSGNDPSKEGTLKKASHVHPKLPDYDSLAATLQSMRENRK